MFGEVDSPLEKFKDKFYEINTSKELHGSVPLRDHELRDTNTMFKKFTNQIERFENHFKSNLSGPSVKEKDLEDFKSRVNELN